MKTCQLWIIIPYKCMFPQIFCIQYLGVLGISNSNLRFPGSKSHRRIIVVFLQLKKHYNNHPLRIPTLYSLQSAFQPHTQRQAEEETEAQTNYRVTCLRSLGQLVDRPGSKPSSSTPELVSPPRSCCQRSRISLRRHEEEKAK